MVALLVGAVVTLSFRIGPTGSGVLAVFPVIYTSIMLILHRRVGGPATAAVLANAVFALAGFGAALLTLHLAAVPLGSALALIAALHHNIDTGSRHHSKQAVGIDKIERRLPLNQNSIATPGVVKKFPQAACKTRPFFFPSFPLECV